MACVTQRKGNWVVDYRKGGRRKRKKFATKKAAKSFLDQLESNVLARASGAFTEVKLKEAIQKYYSEVSEKKSSQSKTNEKLFFTKLYKFFGNRWVSEIYPDEIESFQNELAKTLAASSVNRQFNLYKHFFRKCHQWKYLRELPTEHVKPLKESKAEKPVWKDEEIDLLLEAASGWAKQSIYFLALTGVRPSSLCRIQWKDIDLKEGLVRIKSYKGTGRERLLNLPLSDELITFLEGLKGEARKQWRAKPGDSVFVNASNNPLSSYHICREVRRLSKKLGLRKGLTASGLRHTFITNLVVDGNDIGVVKELAGHGSIVTTSNYVHSDETQKLKAMRELSRKRKFKV